MIPVPNIDRIPLVLRLGIGIFTHSTRSLENSQRIPLCSARTDLMSSWAAANRALVAHYQYQNNKKYYGDNTRRSRATRGVQKKNENSIKNFRLLVIAKCVPAFDFELKRTKYFNRNDTIVSAAHLLSVENFSGDFPTIRFSFVFLSNVPFRVELSFQSPTSHLEYTISRIKRNR